MDINLTKESVYNIAMDYIKKYGLYKNEFIDVEKQVTFYESFHDIKGYAWTVVIEYPSLFPGDYDEITYVISDKEKKVEFVLGPNGTHLTKHLDDKKSDDSSDEWDLLNDI